jgi:hypothetical protein
VEERQMASDQIFVQIASYRDRQLPATIDSLLCEAFDPNRLQICICWQHSPNERIPTRFRHNPNIEILDVDHRESRGANWARRQVQRRWNGEPYSLIIDSHLRFTHYWDQKLIEMMAELKGRNVRRPVITCYPPKFWPQTYPKGRWTAPLKTYKEAFRENLLVHFAGHPIPLWRWLQEPVPAQFLALGFLFTEGSFNREIPIDPNIYFFGDEITTGLRAYCHGYDFFHPHRVLAWHAYDRSTRTGHWQDHLDWRHTDRRSYRRVKRVFEGREYKGYSLGTKRTIKAYEKYIGLPLILGEGRA